MGSEPVLKPWIQIQASPECCEAARRLDGEVMSVWVSPEFPLAECEQSVCRCGVRLLSQDEFLKLTEVNSSTDAPCHQPMGARVGRPD